MNFRPEYKIYASWGPRAEAPEAIAARLPRAALDRLKQIDPAYDDWIFVHQRKPKKFEPCEGLRRRSPPSQSGRKMAIRADTMAIRASVQSTHMNQRIRAHFLMG